MILNNFYKILAGVTGITYNAYDGTVTDAAINKGWNNIIKNSSNPSNFATWCSSDAQTIGFNDYNLTNGAESDGGYCYAKSTFHIGNNGEMYAIFTYEWTNWSSDPKTINSVGFGLKLQGYTSPHNYVMFIKDNLVEPIVAQPRAVVTFTVKITFGTAVS